MSGMFEIHSKLDRVHPLGDQFQTYFAFMNFQTDDNQFECRSLNVPVGDQWSQTID